MKTNSIIITNIVLMILVIATTFTMINFHSHHTHVMDGDMDEMTENFIMQKNAITGELITKGGYRCCLEKPCMYCIEKTPGHGEGATCDCLSDVVNGVHPCGECIGEILEGHGNPYLAEYFAKAIAEKTGHIDVLKEIIFEKYNLSIEDQA